MSSTTNGSIIVEPGAPGTDTVIISIHNLDMAVSIMADELPWLINALGDIHRERQREQRTAESARLLAAMMMG